MSYTNTDLIDSIRARVSLPPNYKDNTLLMFATEELQLTLMKMIKSVREEFYVTSTVVDIVANQNSYSIPVRASGSTVRDVQVETSTDLIDLTPIAREDATSSLTGNPEYYYFQHNSIVLYPTPSASQNELKISYFFRPAKLVAVNDAAKVTSIDTSTNVVTVNNVPTSWSTATIVDFISKNTPYTTIGMDYAITNISGSDITFASLPDDLTEGDYISVQETSPIPQVPKEFQAVLAQMVACRALESQGQLDQLQMAEAKLKRLMDDAISLITPRDEGSNKKVISNQWFNTSVW